MEPRWRGLSTVGWIFQSFLLTYDDTCVHYSSSPFSQGVHHDSCRSNSNGPGSITRAAATTYWIACSKQPVSAEHHWPRPKTWSRGREPTFCFTTNGIRASWVWSRRPIFCNTSSRARRSLCRRWRRRGRRRRCFTITCLGYGWESCRNRARRAVCRGFRACRSLAEAAHV